MTSNISYYEAALAEVREHQSPGSATPEQLQMLSDNPQDWADALQGALDELDSQLEVKQEEFEDALAYAGEMEGERLLDDFNAWKRKNRTFKKYVLRRFKHVQRELGADAPAIDDEAVESALAIAEVAKRLVVADLNDADADTYDAIFDELVALVEPSVSV